MAFPRRHDPEMIHSEHGRRLYAKWKRLREDEHSPEFEQYHDFYNWAMANGYTVGAKLFREYESEPYSPENCYWVPHEAWAFTTKEMRRDPEWEKSWDATVNRIRLYCGMEPIHSSEV